MRRYREAAYEISHKLFFCAIFGRAEMAGVNYFAASPEFEQVHTVIGFQPPGAPLDPFAQLAATADFFINKGRVDIDNGFFIAEADFGRPPDKLLPKRPGPCRGRIDLKLKRPLKTNRIEKIAKQARKTRWRDENLHRINAALLKARYLWHGHPGRVFTGWNPCHAF